MLYGCHRSRQKTGAAKVIKVVITADVGVIGNQLAVEGQAYGGISHTIGYALKEEYDDVKKAARSQAPESPISRISRMIFRYIITKTTQENTDRMVPPDAPSCSSPPAT